jgi:DMSO/TMAO reductase YedYZ heme-binding membrane subunit
MRSDESGITGSVGAEATVLYRVHYYWDYWPTVPSPLLLGLLAYCTESIITGATTGLLYRVHYYWDYYWPTVPSPLLLGLLAYCT